MNFSVNQVRHLYVASAVKTVGATSSVGDIALGSDNAKSHMYFSYMGAGGQMRSDLIDIKNILHIKATPASAEARKLKKVTVTLDASINEGKPVAGQDYVLRLAFRQYVGISDEDIYTKYGVARAFKGMDAAALYNELAASLFRNFSRELVPLVEFEVAGKVVKGVKDGKIVDATGAVITPTEAGIVIKEVEQEWTRGIKEQVPVYFDVIPTTIIADGLEVVWGKAVASEGASVGNGKKAADLEYFCMGERGDMYRGIGWPNNIPTTYLVDPAKNYHYLDIHYAYVGANEGVQKSEKTITIVSDSEEVINGLITAINAATGLSVEAL